MSLEEQYKELLKYRKIQSNNVLIEKQRNAWNFFRNITNVTNLEKNMVTNPPLYYAPLRQIHGSNMVSWHIQNGSEIYVDENFAISNKKLVSIQLQHEMLHNLTSRINGKQSFFGYLYDGSGKPNYIGINEAVTQMFAEDISGVRLNEETDYLYLIKNIMRVMKVLFGKKLIAGQYLNNDLNFTNIFNEKTNYKFEPFAKLMNDVYYLSKNKRYASLSTIQNEEFVKKQKSLLNFVSSLIQQFSQKNEYIINEICSEVQDHLFLGKLGLTINALSSTTHHTK